MPNYWCEKNKKEEIDVQAFFILYLSLPLHSSPNASLHLQVLSNWLHWWCGGWAIIKLDSALKELITVHLPRWQCNKLQKSCKKDDLFISLLSRCSPYKGSALDIKRQSHDDDDDDVSPNLPDLPDLPPICCQ